MKKNKSAFNRRQFIGALAATGAVAAACSGGKTTKQVDYDLTTLLDKAPDGEEIRAGVIGCGGRGSGAAMNFLDAASNVKIVALADVFDALSSKRVYKDAWNENDVLTAIRKNSGSQFDPELVDIFFSSLDMIRAIQRRYRTN